MSFKLTPITAVIQKTTKGGVTQPFIKGIGTNKEKEDAVGKQTIKPGEGVLKHTPKSTASNFEPANPSNANPVPWAFRQDKKIEGGSHSGVKGKMGSENRRKEYDAKGWAYDETIAKPKPKSVKIPKAKGVVGTAKPKLSAKLASGKVVEPKKQQPAKKAVKKAGKKLDSADRKDSRAARVRQKGIDALASGNTKKANRLKRRETRIKNRADKKRGQASRAIDPNN